MKLLIIILLLVLVLYTRFYVKTHNSYEIIQVSLHNVKPTTLLEKQPILLQDRMVHPPDILKTLFKYAYQHKATTSIKDTNPIVCASKFTLLYSTKRDLSINIMLPKYRRELAPYHRTHFALVSKKTLDSTTLTYVTIKLKKQQLLILPYGWIYQTHDPHVHITLNDIFSLLINFLYVGTALGLSRTVQL